MNSEKEKRVAKAKARVSSAVGERRVFVILNNGRLVVPLHFESQEEAEQYADQKKKPLAVLGVNKGNIFPIFAWAGGDL